MNQIKDKVKKARAGVNHLACKHCRRGLVVFKFPLKTVYEIQAKGARVEFKSGCRSCKRENAVLFY